MGWVRRNRPGASARPGAGPPRPAPAAPIAGEVGWAYLPPLQRTIGVAPRITAPHDLVTWRSPTFTGRMSHAVSHSAPSGLVDGDGLGAGPGAPLVRAPELALPLPAPDPAPEPPGAPAVQRGDASDLPAPATVGTVPMLPQAGVVREPAHPASLTVSRTVEVPLALARTVAAPIALGTPAASATSDAPDLPTPEGDGPLLHDNGGVTEVELPRPTPVLTSPLLGGAAGPLPDPFPAVQRTTRDLAAGTPRRLGLGAPLPGIPTATAPATTGSRGRSDPDAASATEPAARIVLPAAEGPGPRAAVQRSAGPAPAAAPAQGTAGMSTADAADAVAAGTRAPEAPLLGQEPPVSTGTLAAAAGPMTTTATGVGPLPLHPRPDPQSPPEPAVPEAGVLDVAEPDVGEPEPPAASDGLTASGSPDRPEPAAPPLLPVQRSADLLGSRRAPVHLLAVTPFGAAAASRPHPASVQRAVLLAPASPAADTHRASAHLLSPRTLAATATAAGPAPGGSTSASGLAEATARPGAIRPSFWPASVQPLAQRTALAPALVAGPTVASGRTADPPAVAAISTFPTVQGRPPAVDPLATSAPVQRETEAPLDAHPAAAGAAAADVPAVEPEPAGPPAAAAAAAPGGPAPNAVPAAATAEELDRLAARLVEPLTRRIKAEMIVDRERRGLRSDPR